MNTLPDDWVLRRKRFDIVDSKEVVWYSSLPEDIAKHVKERSERISKTTLYLREAKNDNLQKRIP